MALHRLAPSHSNIRINPSTDDNKAHHPSTPIYNTALLLALTPKHQLLSTHAVKEESPAFTDAVTLLRVWANQRGYGSGSKLCIKGFEARGFWWSAVLRFLVSGEERVEGAKSTKRKPLGRGLSSYQLFRAALDFLCESKQRRCNGADSLIIIIPAKHKFEQDSVFLKAKEGHHRVGLFSVLPSWGGM